MAEPVPCPAPPRAELLRLVGARLAEPWPALRVIAEELLAAETAIDWVAADARGAAVAVLVGEAGRDVESVARALAHRAWLEPRLRAWVQLAAPGGLRPEAGVRALVLCPVFGAEAIAAASAGGGAVSLGVYRCLRDGAGMHVLLEPVGRAPDAAGREPAALPEPFRTRLTDRDLGLPDDERSEVEPLASPVTARR